MVCADLDLLRVPPHFPEAGHPGETRPAGHARSAYRQVHTQFLRPAAKFPME